MKNLVLQDPVPIGGKSLLGRNSHVEFIPSVNGRTSWKTGIFDNGTEASLKNTRVRFRRICLESQSPRSRHIDVVEHMMAMRWMGLEFSFITDRLPYFPRTHELWEMISSGCVDGDRDIRWFRPLSSVYSHIPGLEVCPENAMRLTPHGEERWVKIEAAEGGFGAEIGVTVDFEGIGRKHKSYIFPNTSLLKQVFRARPVVLPPWLYYLRDVPVLRLVYPFSNNLLWPQMARSYGNLLDEICDHRALDILGALALATPGGLPAVRFTSYCAGHAHDVCALRKVTWIE